MAFPALFFQPRIEAMSVYGTPTHDLQDELGRRRQLLPSGLGSLPGRGEEETAASHGASCGSLARPWHRSLTHVAGA